MNIKYKIKEVKPNIFAVIIKDSYDRAMLFCRGQEYYESPNKKFRGKYFSIWDYMKWYSSEYKRGFSYGSDWSGFNIPFEILWECYENLNELPDWETPYDGYMWEILVQIDNIRDQNKKAYVIGAGNTEDDTFQHEVCHGLWYTNAAYKKEAMFIVKAIDPNHYKIFKHNLLEMGYTNSVIDDEIQAYLTTNWDYERFGKGVDLDKRKKYHQAFTTTLNDFLK
jgi:hypothetical protein